MWTHSTWDHVAFREFQSHRGPGLGCGSHLVRPQSIEPYYFLGFIMKLESE